MELIGGANAFGSALAEAVKSGQCILFAGAGVSARTGLPVWHSYLGYLADVVGAREPMIGELIKKRVRENSLLLAAQYFKTCTELPIGERLAKLAEPFQSGKYDASKIASLLALPFSSIVTTNYDRSLHDAFASVRGKTAVQVELGDATLKAASFMPDSFIARLHGRSELPETMVLDAEDYKKLYQNTEYNDFLHTLLMQRRCIFIGFSFEDPAISHVLDFIQSKGVYPQKHFACLPSKAVSLTERMSNQNIEVLLYDESTDHQLLWDGIAYAAKVFHGQAPAATPETKATFEIARRLLAVCYARARMADDGLALRSVIVQGIVLSELDAGASTIADLAHRLHKYIALDAKEASGIVSSAVDSLVGRKLCMTDGEDVVLVNKLADFVAHSPGPRLAQAIVDRLMVREQFDANAEIRSALERITEEVIVLRGFDLGAEFAGARFSGDIDATSTVQKTIERHLPKYWQDRKSQIAAAFLDLIRRPTPAEEELLADAGRVSFGIEMVLQAGRATMYTASLPEVVYLDASVLMPAIVSGHPFQRPYVAALSKLQEAAEAEGSSTAVMISDVFLNEIVTHRKRAVAIVEELGLDTYDLLKRRIQYYGADNVNVFIGAYSTWAARQGRGTFQEFLAAEAPYATEDELASFLKAKGIRVASTKPISQSDTQRYEFVKERLLDGYDRVEFGWENADRKALVLKKHEAAQISLLLATIRNGRRAVLVTADKGLRRVATAIGISELKDALISHRNLVQLVDLLVGLRVESGSLARLLWTVRIADDRTTIRDYLIVRALPQYDAALSLKMSDLIDGIVERVAHEAHLEGIKFGSNSFSERSKEIKFIDRIEVEVFAQLAEEVKKLKEELRQKDRTN